MLSETKKQASILHVDINSYFATLLQQENPALQGRPVAVVKAPGRTCIIAASKEAKARGVRTGSRVFEVQAQCPDLVVLPAAFDRYLDATKRLQKIFTQSSPDFFIYSLDEAFIDLSSCLQFLYTSPQEAAAVIQRRIASELGAWVTCSVGIARTRLLAKMASDLAPKGGVLTITTKNQDYFLSKATFESVCGVGRRLSTKLQQSGIVHPYQLRFFSLSDLERLVGKFWASQLQIIGYGDEPHLLQLLDTPLEHMKSVSRSITGYRVYQDQAEILAIMQNLGEEVCYKARRMKLLGRHVSVAISSRDQWWADHVMLAQPMADGQVFWQQVKKMLKLFWQKPFPVIKFMVRLSLLEPESQVPKSLFRLDEADAREYQLHDRYDKVTEAVDMLWDRYGMFVVKPASLLQHPIIKPEVTGFLGDRIYHGL